MNKQAQVSIFLILAAVIVIVGGIGWYVVSLLADSSSPETVSVDSQGVRGFVQSCLKESAYASLDAIGRGAGYIDSASLGYSSSELSPTEYPALQPFPGEPVLPYWTHLESKNTCTRCTIGREQPALTGPEPSIEFQLQQDIATRLLSCVGDFSQIEGVTVEPLADPVISIVFSDLDTTILLKYPLRVTGGEDAAVSDSYTEKLDVPLQKLYKVAYDITEQTENSHFFEGLALESITYASLDNNIPPPSGSLDVGYDPGPIWALAQVQQEVADALYSSVGIVQLYASRNMNFVRTGDPTTDRMYANYYFAVGESVQDIDASFVYLPSWQPYVVVQPGGQVIAPKQLAKIPFFPQFKRTDFQYDVSFPVLVQLRADTTRGPYLFQFPVEANMRGNKPIEFDQPSAANDEIDFCQAEVAIGSTAQITIVDKDTGAPMNARLSFNCIENTCSYGETIDGTFSQRLPVCVAGTLIAERDGYRSAQVRLDSIRDETRVVPLQLARLTELPVTIDAFTLARAFRAGTPDEPLLGPWAVAGRRDTFGEPYKAIVTFASLDDPTDVQVVAIPPDPDQIGTVAVSPGDYEVTVTVIETLTEPHVVKGKEVCGGGVLGIGDTCTTIDDITFGDGAPITLDDGSTVTPPAGQLPVGGVNFDATTRYFTVTQEMIASGAIAVPTFVLPREELAGVDDLEIWGSYNDFVPGLP